MLKVLNNKNVPVNILHFQGTNVDILKRTFYLVKEYAVLKPLDFNLSVVSCWTNDAKCHLLHQLQRHKIDLINAIPDDYDYSSKWDMRNKIQFYIDTLKNKVKTKYVLLLDGYDVVFASTDDILKKFKKTGYRIIFNTSFNKFPDEDIDYVEDRDSWGFFKYFNAGCCIGYRTDLIKFYEECLEFINAPNILNSEQKVLRLCFAKYSNDKKQKFIWVDYNREIFHTMGLTVCNYNATKEILRIDDNIEAANKKENRKALKEQFIVYLNSLVNNEN